MLTKSQSIICLSLFSLMLPSVGFSDSKFVSGREAISTIANILKGNSHFPMMPGEELALPGKSADGRQCTVSVELNDLGLILNIERKLGGTKLADMSISNQEKELEVVSADPFPAMPGFPNTPELINAAFYVTTELGRENSLSISESFAMSGATSKFLKIEIKNDADSAACTVKVDQN